MKKHLKAILSLLMCLTIWSNVPFQISASGETASIGETMVARTENAKAEVPYFLSGIDSTYPAYTGISITMRFDNTKLEFEEIKEGGLKTSKDNPIEFIYTSKENANKDGFVKLSWAGTYDSRYPDKGEAIIKDGFNKDNPAFYLVFTKKAEFSSGETTINLKEHIFHTGDASDNNIVKYGVKDGIVRVRRSSGRRPSKKDPESIKPVTPPDKNPGKEKFIDIDGVDWAHNAIDNVAKKGVMVGISDNKFGPDLGIKRGDIALMTDRLFEFDAKPSASYKDVDKDMYYAEAISKLTTLGIAKGYGENLYAPEKTVNRQEMVVFCYRALKLKNMLPENVDVEKEISLFKDRDKLEEYAEIPMATFISLGIIKGRSGNMLAPQDYITRAEAASIFDRLSQYIENIKY